MKLFKQYLKESLVVENTELADLKKHLHDQQMKYAAAQKRKDKRAMDFWNHAIKNTEEEIKYYENENFSSTSDNENDKLNVDKIGKQLLSNLRHVMEVIPGTINHYKLKDDLIHDGSLSIYGLGDGSHLIKVKAKIETSSESLADKTKNYQTTSARRVSFKNINRDFEINNSNDIVKAIDKIKNILK
jgi:hypothetical protein